MPSPYGDIEFTDGGSGSRVLVIHDSGGGYDQGKLIVQAFLGNDFHWIAPSRFGYLGTPLPSDPLPPAEADTWICSWPVEKRAACLAVQA